MRKKKRNINFENISLQSDKSMILYNCPKGTEDNNRQGRGQVKPQGERRKSWKI